MRIELFTHPVCSGCREALLALAPLQETGEIELVCHSLATGSGRARAQEAGVTSVPTAVVRRVVRELATRDALERLIGEIRAVSAD